MSLHMDKGEVRFIGKVINIEGELSTINLYEDFCKGLYRLEEYTYLNILYWFHLRDNKKHRETILVIPKRHGETTERGVFASKSGRVIKKHNRLSGYPIQTKLILVKWS